MNWLWDGLLANISTQISTILIPCLVWLNKLTEVNN